MADENEIEKDDETTAAAAEAPVAEDAATGEAAAEEAAPETAEPEAAEPETAAEPEAEATPEAGEAPAVEEAAAEEPAAPAEEPAVEEPAPAGKAPKKNKKRLARPLRHKHSKPAREPAAERKPIGRTAKEDSVPGRRQERRGVVVSDKGDKSIVVKVEMIRAHRKYKKVVRTSSRLHAHDEQNSAGIGDVVRIVETRPLSKTKRWRLAEIVEKAK
jgi:small subunit ribosomal protein S17